LRQLYWDIRGLGVELVAAANDTPETNEDLRQTLDLPFTILADEGAEIARAYRAFHENEPRGRSIALISFFLIGQDGTIGWEYVGPTSRHRVTPSRLLEEIQRFQGRERLVTPAEITERMALTWRDYARELAMQANAEVHRFIEEGWTVASVTPEFEGTVSVGQRWVLTRLRE
jgi:alkyl hydroperoxide reductase subunit AhpC